MPVPAWMAMLWAHSGLPVPKTDGEALAQKKYLFERSAHLDKIKALHEIANEPVLVSDGEFAMERALIRCQNKAKDALKK